MAPKIKLIQEVTGETLLKHVKLNNTFWQKCGEAIRDGMLRNVRDEKRGDGSSQKVNAPSTRRRKRNRSKRAQEHPKSLHDKKLRFANKTGYKIAVAKNAVAVGPSDTEVTEHVQRKGYTGWVEPDVRAFEKIRLLFAKIIMAATSKAKKHKSRKVLKRG